MNYEFEIKGSKYLFNSASLKLFKNIVPEGQEKANEVDVVKDKGLLSKISFQF